MATFAPTSLPSQPSLLAGEEKLASDRSRKRSNEATKPTKWQEYDKDAQKKKEKGERKRENAVQIKKLQAIPADLTAKCTSSSSHHLFVFIIL